MCEKTTQKTTSIKAFSLKREKLSLSCNNWKKHKWRTLTTLTFKCNKSIQNQLMSHVKLCKFISLTQKECYFLMTICRNSKSWLHWDYEKVALSTLSTHRTRLLQVRKTSGKWELLVLFASMKEEGAKVSLYILTKRMTPAHHGGEISY